MNSIPRYCPERPLPPYSYVPGLAPHPTSDERGHSFGRHEQPPGPLNQATWQNNETYRYAIDLFNHGFYWEAHEVWESLWHVAGRKGTTADFLKGLIKLAAAGVKAREGRAAGVRQHAERAEELFRAEQSQGGQDRFGLSLLDLIEAAEAAATSVENLRNEGKADAARLLPIVLRLAM